MQEALGLISSTATKKGEISVYPHGQMSKTALHLKKKKKKKRQPKNKKKQPT
jgi:hypothetical protein